MKSRAELVTASALGISAVAAIAFVVDYLANSSTQLMGIAFGVALLALAAGLIAAGRLVVRQTTETEPRPQLEDEAAVEEVNEMVHESQNDITRRGLLTGAGIAAAGALTVAGIVPLASLGPETETRLGESPWRAGTRLVDDRGRPIPASSIVVGSFVTAFPEGADPREVGSPAIVVGLKTSELDLPADRTGWAAGGVVAYSKICTHAGCAVGMLRYPLYPAHSPPPGLVCPCHYSTFDPASGGTVTFGPAGRPLPQLPLRVRADGTLEAAGHMSGPIGPGWWSVNA